METKAYSIVLPVEIMRQAKMLAARDGLSFRQLIIDAVAAYIASRGKL